MFERRMKIHKSKSIPGGMLSTHSAHTIYAGSQPATHVGASHSKSVGSYGRDLLRAQMQVLTHQFFNCRSFLVSASGLPSLVILEVEGLRGAYQKAEKAALTGGELHSAWNYASSSLLVIAGA
jgi:hypothetical protein